MVAHRMVAAFHGSKRVMAIAVALKRPRVARCLASAAAHSRQQWHRGSRFGYRRRASDRVCSRAAHAARLRLAVPRQLLLMVSSHLHRSFRVGYRNCASEHVCSQSSACSFAHARCFMSAAAHGQQLRCLGSLFGVATTPNIASAL